VISELRKKVPINARNWFEDKDQNLFYISVVTVAEILDGIERLPDSKKKMDLEDWFYGEIQTRFIDRMLHIDDHVAREWAFLNSSLQKEGITVSVQDLYIAATVRAHGFALVTLNVKAFHEIDIPIINPWI
jgi:predicted nucleic acid-binding protein